MSFVSRLPLPLSSALALLLVAPVTATAAPLLRPAGPAFEVVTEVDTPPGVALDGYGRATVVWADSGNPARLWARSHDPQFRPLGRAWLVHEPEAAPFGWRVVASRRGRVLVTWAEGMPEAARSAYKLFAADGTLIVKGELGAGEPAGPALAAVDGAGRFAVAWQESDGVYAQLFDAAGSVRVARFRVATAQAHDTLEPRAVVADAAGAVVIFWRDVTLTPTRFYGRRYDAAGSAQGAPFEVDGVDSAAAVAGRIALAWVDARGAQPRVLLQRRSPAGVPLGSTRTVHTGVWADQPRIAADGAGNFVVGFRGARGAGSDVFARRYTADGNPDGKPFALADAAAAVNTELDLAGSPNGDVLAVWLRATPVAPALRGRGFRVPVKGDLDGDLRADLLLRRPHDGATRVWTMSEARRESNLRVWRNTPGPDWTLVSADDFTGDRRQDLVFRHDGTGAVRFVALGGAAGNEICATVTLQPAGPAGSRLVATGDFDADGWPDLVWHDADTHALRVWTMRGTQHTGTLTPTRATVPDASWELLGVHDWNGDGTRDLLWHDGTTDTLEQWLLDADLARTGTRALDPPSAASSEWSVVATGDFGVGPGGVAGTADLAWRNARTGRQVVWFLDAGGRRTAGVFTTPAKPSGAVVLAGPR